MKAALIATLGLLAGWAGVPAAQAQEHHWRIQGYVPDSFKVNAEFRQWAAELKSKSGDRIEIELLPIGAVIGPADGLDAVRNGILTGLFQGSAYSAAKDPAFAIAGDTMGAYETADQRQSWWSDGGGKEVMRKLYAQHGVYMIGPVYTPAQVIPSKKPLRNVEDFQGLKIRGASGATSALFQSMGAGAVVLPGTELFNALQTGVIDATSWGWYTLNYETGLYDAARYSVNARHSMATVEVVVSQKAWDALDDDLKQLVEAELETFSAHMREIYIEDDEATKKLIADKGVEIIEWEPEEYGKIRALTARYWESEAAKSASAREMVDSHAAYIEKLGIE